MLSDQERIFKEIDDGIAELQLEIDNINNAAEILTGGLSIDEVLNPEGTITEDVVVNNLEEDAVAEQTKVTVEDFPGFEFNN